MRKTSLMCFFALLISVLCRPVFANDPFKVFSDKKIVVSKFSEIQPALDSGAGVVEMLPGEYKIKSKIILKTPNQTLKGQGSSTFLILDTDDDAIEITGTKTVRWALKDFRLSVNRQAYSRRGIVISSDIVPDTTTHTLNADSHSLIENIEINDCGGPCIEGLKGAKTRLVKLYNVRGIFGNAEGIITTEAQSDWLYVNVNMIHMAKTGHLAGEWASQWVNCKYDWNGVKGTTDDPETAYAGLVLLGTGNQVHGLQTQSNYGHGVIIKGDNTFLGPATHTSNGNKHTVPGNWADVVITKGASSTVIDGALHQRGSSKLYYQNYALLIDGGKNITIRAMQARKMETAGILIQNAAHDISIDADITDTKNGPAVAVDHSKGECENIRITGAMGDTQETHTQTFAVQSYGLPPNVSPKITVYNLDTHNTGGLSGLNENAVRKP